MERPRHFSSCDDAQRSILRSIERCDYDIVHVLPEQDTCGWAYTVGLWQTLRHPEILAFGLQPTITNAMFGKVVDGIRAGRPLEPDREHTHVFPLPVRGMISGVRCVYESVAAMWHVPFLGMADWYYEGADYRVLQCFPSDAAGRYPWDRDVDDTWRQTQPLLFRTSISAARVSKLIASMKLSYRPPR